ncbi:MAG: zinc ribbon domain-containing protein [Candidatus Altiarchaeales archaeon]|nr:zinc ribbon domain-containing protein [Candidatus Altiarchaeales archaeon]
MTGLKKAVLNTTAVTAGGLLYVGLNWIPIIGPLAVGFLVGYTAKDDPRNGFRLGVYSATFGAFLLAVILGNSGLFNTTEAGTLLSMLVAWILVMWNLAGIMLAGLGGILGSLVGQARTMLGMIPSGLNMIPFGISFGMPKPRRVLKLQAPPGGEEKRIKFRICENCGSSNQEDSKTCENCRKKLG